MFLSLYLCPFDFFHHKKFYLAFFLFAMKQKPLLAHPIKHPLIMQIDRFVFHSQKAKLPIVILSKKEDKSQQVEFFPNFSLYPRASWIHSCFSRNPSWTDFKNNISYFPFNDERMQKSILKWILYYSWFINIQKVTKMWKYS